MRNSGISRHLRRAALTAAFLVVLGGSIAHAQEAADAPRPGGTLTVALHTDVRELDAINARVQVDKLVLGSTVYDPLFQTDQNGNPVPALATGAEPSADAREWTFHLREGVTFHNGKPFTAEDVKKTIEAIKDPARASNMAGDLANIKAVAVVDDHEVKIMLERPDGQLPGLFTEFVFITDMDDHRPGHPIGTGPYAWEQRIAGDRITFARFENHWRGKPPLDRVIFRIIPDAQVAALELQAGGVDIVPTNLSPDFLPVLRADPNITLYEMQGSTVYHAYLNFEKARRGGYKDDQAFREGMAHLWNAQALVPPIIGDFGTLASQWIPPWQAGHDPSIEPWVYDPEKGKALLAQAGVEEGDPIDLFVWIQPHNCNHAMAFASQLTELGYDPKVTCLQPTVALQALQSYDWDLLFVSMSGRTNAYQNFRDRWRMSLAPNPPNDVWTMRDQALEDIINQMGATADQEEYVRLAQRAGQIVAKEKIGMLPAYWENVRVAVNKRVRGIEVSPLTYYGFLMNMMTTVWLADE